MDKGQRLVGLWGYFPIRQKQDQCQGLRVILEPDSPALAPLGAPSLLPAMSTLGSPVGPAWWSPSA